VPGSMPSEFPAGWSQLTREQKREWRFDRWRRSEQYVPFVSPEAEASYKAKIERLIAVFNVQEPDRVPVSAMAGLLALQAAGLDYHTAIYHPEKARDAGLAFNREHAEDLDSFTPSGFFSMPARAFDILDNRLYAYPGRGMSTDGKGFQYVEGEYMLPDEYDALIRDPSDFWLRTYLPRVYGVFGPLAHLEPLTDVTEIFAMQLPSLARPEVQAMLQRLLDAGRELARYLEITAPEMGEAAANGHASLPPGGFAKAPFDTLGDTLRGTRGIMTDMLRQPDKLLQALDVVTELTIASLLGSSAVAGGISVMFPLHKGADGWMSEEQFLTFYWPSLRKVMDAIIGEGLMVSLFAEGSYNTRLELVNEFPKGAVHWMFDRTDMARAKRLLGTNCSIEGNVPSSLLVIGSPQEVKAECCRLIEICAPGGGYILGPGAIPEYPRLENLKAMVEAAREYGVYARG
jgi:hypothetical protein